MQVSDGVGLGMSNSLSQLPDFLHCWGSLMRLSYCGCSMEGGSYRQESSPGLTCVCWCCCHRVVGRPSRQVD